VLRVRPLLVPRVHPLIAAALLVTGAVQVYAAPAAASSCVYANAEAKALSQTQLESAVTCLVNEQRVEAGFRSLRSNGRLRQAALGHSQDMVQEGYFEHTSPSGATFIDRITRTGYIRGARHWLVGENLVWGSGSRSTPQALVGSWMGSPAHRANLLRARFREVGVAAVRGTPVDAADHSGVTLTSEYGFRGKRRDRSR
jgi:uncharacterized protein YkwD